MPLMTPHTNLNITLTKVICITSLLLTACDFGMPTFATEEQKKEVMKKAKFDGDIILNIPAYDELKDFLFKYSDTITSYRDSKNIVIEVGGAGKTDTLLHKSDCYNFFQGNINYDITNVPDFLKRRLGSIYNKLGDRFIKSFEICKKKKITIEVRSEGGRNGLYISHVLIWNGKIERDYAYIDNKDTAINGNCIYRIGMTEEHGH